MSDSSLPITVLGDLPGVLPETLMTSAVSPAGFTAPIHLTSAEQAEALAEVASQILADPISQMKLCNRIYRLMEQDLRNQIARCPN